MGGVEMERHLGVGLTPPTLNHQEKPPDTQSTSGGVGGGRGQPRPLSRLELSNPERPLPTQGQAPVRQGQAPVRQGTMPLLRSSFSVLASIYKHSAPLGLHRRSLCPVSA